MTSLVEVVDDCGERIGGQMASLNELAPNYSRFVSSLDENISRGSTGDGLCCRSSSRPRFITECSSEGTHKKMVDKKMKPKPSASSTLSCGVGC